MFCLDQAHDQTLRRSAKQTVDDVAHMLTDDLAAADGGLIKICAVFERALNLALAMQDVEHGLDRGVRQFALKMLLHSLHVDRAGGPQNEHDVELQRRSVF